MSNFKAQTQADSGVFLNANEFAEYNDINGEKILSLIDETDYQEYKPSSQYDNDGVFIKYITLFVNQSDLGYTPVIDEQIRLNNQRYYVVSVIVNMGLLEIKLREYLA